MKKLIVNADDFGLLNCVNSGITEAYNKGILTSSTMMLNMPGSADAIELAKKYSIPTGIHLNLNAGKPLVSYELSDPLTGEFYKDVYVLIDKIKTGVFSENSIEKELYAQLALMKDSGLNITHIDSHKHSHQFLPLFKIIEKLAEKFGIKKIRMSADVNFYCDINAETNFNSKDFSYQLYIQYNLNNGNYRSLWYEEYFLFAGFFFAGKIDKDNFTKIFLKLPDTDKPIEIMFHPAYNSTDLEKISSLTYHRETELKTLISDEIFDIIKKNNVNLCDFQLINKKLER